MLAIYSKYFIGETQSVSLPGIEVQCRAIRTCRGQVWELMICPVG